MCIKRLTNSVLHQSSIFKVDLPCAQMVLGTNGWSNHSFQTWIWHCGKMYTLGIKAYASSYLYLLLSQLEPSMCHVTRWRRVMNQDVLVISLHAPYHRDCGDVLMVFFTCVWQDPETSRLDWMYFASKISPMQDTVHCDVALTFTWLTNKPLCCKYTHHCMHDGRYNPHNGTCT